MEMFNFPFRIRIRIPPHPHPRQPVKFFLVRRTKADDLELEEFDVQGSGRIVFGVVRGTPIVSS